MGICRFLPNIYFSVFLFFKYLIMDYASQCSEMYNKREKNKKKKTDRNPPKYLAYVDFYNKYIFIFFIFLSNLSWIMHHSVQKCTTKGKKTRKKSQTKTPQKIWHTSICRVLKKICFFCFSFFKVTYHGLCITVFRNVQQKGKKTRKKRQTETPPKIRHTSIICRFFLQKLYFSLFHFFYVT